MPENIKVAIVDCGISLDQLKKTLDAILTAVISDSPHAAILVASSGSKIPDALRAAVSEVAGAYIQPASFIALLCGLLSFLDEFCEQADSEEDAKRRAESLKAGIGKITNSDKIN